MKKTAVLTVDQMLGRAAATSEQMRTALRMPRNTTMIVYGIPRGGVKALEFLKAVDPNVVATLNPTSAHAFLDDIIDSGATAEEYASSFPEKQFFALVDKLKNEEDSQLGWVVFPWEDQDQDVDFEHTVRRLLQHIGEDPNRGGLLETPARVVAAWRHWTSGYDLEPEDVLKEFEDGGESYDEMILVRDIPFYSHCEHHLTPFFGTADIAYIPNGKIVGLSKLSRLLDIFAHRLQVQERLTAQVADALMGYLKARGAAVSIKARHLCMESRGIKKQGSLTVTNVMRGVFFEDAKARSEFLDSIK